MLGIANLRNFSGGGRAEAGIGELEVVMCAPTGKIQIMGVFSFFFLADSPETMTVVGLESTILGVVTWNRLHNTLLSIVPEQVLFIRVSRYIDLVAVSDFTDHLQRGHTEYFGVHYRNRKV